MQQGEPLFTAEVGNAPYFLLHFVEGRYPAACREFVIPAEAGIHRARLDSVSSTE